MSNWIIHTEYTIHYIVPEIVYIEIVIRGVKLPGIAAYTACIHTQIHMQLVIRGVRLPAPCFCKGDHCSNRTTECTLWNCPLLLNASDVCAILYGYVCATKY